MKKINPNTTKSWKKLKNHFKKIKKIKIKKLFSQQKNRFLYFSQNFYNQIIFDYSKNRITKKTLQILLNLAKECNIKKHVKNMFKGKKINFFEKKPVLHTALRKNTKKKFIINKINITKKINQTLYKIKKFSKKIIKGRWKGYKGNKITDIVNIGIGGSNLGPKMIIKALQHYKNHLKIHFISNIDGNYLEKIIKKINHKKTIFIIISKTFTTKETLTNAKSIKSWFLKITGNKKYIKKHFIAISNNTKNVKKFGITKNNIFKLWNWINGRFSLWSSVGFSIALSIGYSNFKKLLYGANKMDKHFLYTPMHKNIPIILALISIWYNNFFKFETEAILIYDQYTKYLPEYLQQSFMESNGKSIDLNKKKIKYQTSQIIWGGTGTDSQHSFYQLFHQGTKIIPCDFIIPVKTHNKIKNHHLMLLSNFFAQTQALAFGNKKNNSSQIFKQCDGNKPSNSILIKKITPKNLGSLIAMYEHKIFVQGIIFNINSFDQWGVEIGKKFTNSIFTELKNKTLINKYDNSTKNLIKYFYLWNK